jgi:hypothetical protein
MKIEIKSRFSLEVIFSHECENNSVAITVQAAINAKANLRSADLYGADLYGANLRSADLYGADLRSADLRSANLGGANLGSANLYGANLRSANLGGANLGSADLRSANLYGANLRSADLGESGKLTGDRPFFQVGPIGSRQDNLLAFQTEKGIFLRAGCFFGTVEEFRDKLEDEHGDNAHGKEYKAALVMVEAHYSVWPTTD